MKITVTIAALAATLLGANAATTIFDTTATTPVNQANFNLSNTGFSFTTGTLGLDAFLNTVLLEGPQSGAIADTYSITIYADADNNASTFGLGSALGTSLNSAALGINATSVFTFAPESITLADNTVYFAMINRVTGSTGSIRVGLVQTNAYSGGQFFNGGTAYNPTGFDISGGVTTIPEPSIALISGLGMLALLRRRRA